VSPSTRKLSSRLKQLHSLHKHIASVLGIESLPENVAIVILNCNQAGYTRDCLLSLQQLDYVYRRILVVDNGSSDGALHAVASDFPDVEFLWLTENLGVAGGRNAGVRKVLQHNPGYVLFLDNDTLVAPDFLTQLVHRIGSDPAIGAVQPKIYFADARDRICSFGGKFYSRISHYRHPHSGHCDTPETQIPAEIDIVSGCAGLFRTEAFRHIGLIDETFSPYCHEDVDWSLRLRKCGYRLIVEPRAVIWHRVSSSAVANGPKLKELAKAHILFLRFNTRFYDFPLSVAWISLHMLRRYLLPVLAIGDWRAIKGIFGGVWLGLKQKRRPLEWPSDTDKPTLPAPARINLPNGSKKRILLGGVLAPFDSGPTRVYETLLRSRFTENFTVRFLDLQFAQDIRDFERLRWKKFVRLARCLLATMYCLTRERYDALCLPLSTNRNAFLKDSLFLWVGFLFRIPVVVFEHGTNIPALYDRSGWLFRAFMGATLRRVKKYIVLAENLKFNFEGFVPSNRIASVYLGIDPFTPVHREIPTAVGKPTTLLFLSTLLEAKGILVFLEAFSCILRERRDVSCVIAGTWGWDSEKVKAQIDAFLCQNYACASVRMLGPVKGEEKQRAYDQSDIFVFPTMADASPHVVLEAMRAGLPIVASDVGAIPELVKDHVNGLICKKGDPGDLASKILYLLDRPGLRAQMSRDNLQRFQSIFTADKFADRMIQLFQSMFHQDGKQSANEATKPVQSIETVQT
jgi:GT2 family glycosyltransferase